MLSVGRVLPGAGKNTVTLTFDEVREMAGGLPPR